MDDAQRDSAPDGQPGDLDLDAIEAVVRSSRLDTSGAPPDVPRFKLVREYREQFHPPLVRPLLLAADPQGNILVVERYCPESYRLREIPRQGAVRMLGLDVPQGSGEAELLEPAGLAVDAEGDLYLLDAAAGAVKKFRRDGRWLESFTNSGLGDSLDGPRDVAVDAAGGIYLADTNNDRIVKLRSDGEQDWALAEFPTGEGGSDGCYEPSSLCLAADGALIVADTNQNRLLRFDPGGQSRGVFPCRPLEFPSRVRADAAGQFYVVDQAGARIGRFDASGRETGCLRLGGLGLEGFGLESSAGFAVDPDGHVLVINALRESISVLAFLET